MHPAIYLAGPTASGKSAVALELAARLSGEIVSVDSMQVYRGMDIGTAKPSAADRARIAHHLIDVADIRETFDAARFVALAREAEKAIRARGKMPIFCGGTGLYFNALIGGLAPGAAGDPSLRAELEHTPLPELLEELKQRDPESFARIDQKNPRRVIRAVELLRATAAPLSVSRPNWTQAHQEGLWFGIQREREDLYARIDRRVEQMFAQGLVRETELLLARGLAENRTAAQALGYRQIIGHIEGERDLAATIALVKQKTRHYAKRQITWFQHQLELTWIQAAAESSTTELASRIEKLTATDPQPRVTR